MTYLEVCNKYHLEKTKKGEHVVLNSVSTDDLESIKSKMKSRIRELDTLISQSLNQKTTAKTKAQQRALELIQKKELTTLSDEEYYSKIIMRAVEDEISRRRRNFVSVSAKALNNGGVYTTGHLVQPRVGMGFHGYGGVCL